MDSTEGRFARAWSVAGAATSAASAAPAPVAPAEPGSPEAKRRSVWARVLKKVF